MDKNTRGSSTGADDTSDFFEWGIFEEPDVNRFLLAAAQRAHRLSQTGIGLVTFGHFRGISEVCPSEPQPRPSALATPVIASQVEDRLVKPGTESTHLSWSPGGKPDPHERLLNDVLGDRVIAHEKDRQLKRRALQLMNQGLDPRRLRRL